MVFLIFTPFSEFSQVKNHLPFNFKNKRKEFHIELFKVSCYEEIPSLFLPQLYFAVYKRGVG